MKFHKFADLNNNNYNNTRTNHNYQFYSNFFSLLLFLVCFEEDPDKVKDTLRKYKQSPLALDPNFISLKEKVGNGFFGEVFLGRFISIFFEFYLINLKINASVINDFIIKIKVNL